MIAARVVNDKQNPQREGIKFVSIPRLMPLFAIGGGGEREDIPL